MEILTVSVVVGLIGLNIIKEILHSKERAERDAVYSRDITNLIKVMRTKDLGEVEYVLGTPEPVQKEEKSTLVDLEDMPVPGTEPEK